MELKTCGHTFYVSLRFKTRDTTFFFSIKFGKSNGNTKIMDGASRRLDPSGCLIMRTDDFTLLAFDTRATNSAKAKPHAKGGK